jgi:L-2-hydroxyglutarate oxidase
VSTTFDFCIIGAGIVGLATARHLLERQPGAKLVVLEKENAVARHQTGRNSGVIHSGIYYAAGSLKARLCVKGAQATKAFCDEHCIRYETCGKLLVATNETELTRMNTLYERAHTNSVEVERIDSAELRRREPNIVGVGALFVPATGIVSYRQIAAKMAELIRAGGGAIEFGTRVDGIRESASEMTIAAGGSRWSAKKLIACAGLQSDRLARLAGCRIEHQIIPFRGEYYRLPAARNGIIRHLIYPIPDPDLPFLGIHLTRMIDGSVTVGPNAVLGFAREGYPKLSIDLHDLAEYATFSGFWKMLGAHLRSGVHELHNSLSKHTYLEECRKYCPSLTVDDLLPAEAGIRAQAVLRDGTLVHDFLFIETERMLHVCNAPSPAATSAIPIAETIVQKILGR